MMRKGWIDVNDELPADDSVVLAVKELKDGRRDICMARCIKNYEWHDYATRTTHIGPYWTCAGNNNIIFWMPLPDMPEVY